jgi:hypothetical protein
MEIIIENYLAQAFMNQYLVEIVPQMDASDAYKKRIEEIKLIRCESKSKNEIIAWISYEVEHYCFYERHDMNGAINLMATDAYLFSKAFELKLGSISEVFFLLVENYNNHRRKTLGPPIPPF